MQSYESSGYADTMNAASARALRQVPELPARRRDRILIVRDAVHELDQPAIHSNWVVGRGKLASHSGRRRRARGSACRAASPGTHAAGGTHGMPGL